MISGNTRRLLYLYFVSSLLVLPFFAHAADTICGADTDNNGSVDTWCDTNDADRDGSIAADDCDDNNLMIYPGVTTASGCSAGQYRTCGNDGEYTACSSAELCEATGTGECYYVDPVDGSNSNDGLTRATAFASLAMVGYYYYTETPPAGHITLAAGDVVYLMTGDHDAYDTGYVTIGDMASFAMRGRSGTSSNRITVKGYPGEAPVMTGYVYIEDSDYWTFSDFKIDGARLKFTGNSDYVRVQRLTVVDSDGNQDSNLGGITSENTNTGALITHNVVRDVYDRSKLASARSENNSGILLFTSIGATVKYNQVLNSDIKMSNCIKQKHANADNTMSTVQYNVCNKTCLDPDTNIAYAFGFGGSVDLEHNYAGGMTDGCSFLMLRDFGGGHNFSDGVIAHYNTADGGNNVLFPSDSSGYGYGDGISVKYNVLVDSSSSGYTMNLCHYGDNTYYANLITANKFSADYNCYYTPNKEFSGSIFGGSPANGTYCGTSSSTSDGAAYASFAAWQAAGYDTHSYDENPTLDNSGAATSANCDEFGWAIAGVGSTTTTTAPVTTTIPANAIGGTGDFLNGIWSE